MDNQILEVGNIYKVNSSRKGKFQFQLTSQCDTWATGIALISKMHNKHNIETGQLVKYIGASRLLRSEQFEFVKETGNKVCCKRISDGVHWTFNMRDIEPI